MEALPTLKMIDDEVVRTLRVFKDTLGLTCEFDLHFFAWIV